MCILPKACDKNTVKMDQNCFYQIFRNPFSAGKQAERPIVIQTIEFGLLSQIRLLRKNKETGIDRSVQLLKAIGEGPGFHSRQGQRLPFLLHIETNSVVYTTSCPVGAGTLSMGVKRP